MNSRIVLLAISVFAVGIFAMPGTLSLFSGQHTFSNIASDPYICRKCHMEVYDELMKDDGGNPRPHSAFTTCRVCHRTGNLSDYGFYEGLFGISGDPSVNFSNMGAHAAITVECIFCHNAVNSNFTDDAHQPLAEEVPKGLMKGNNTVCVSCHTKATTQIVFIRFKNVTINYNFTNETNKLTWNNGSMNTTYVNRT